MVVYFSIGHGGRDPGNVNFGLREADVALDMGIRIARNVRLLSKPGRDPISSPSLITTIMSRTSDVFVDISSQCRHAINAKTDLMVSLHTNSVTLNKSRARGAEVFVSAAGSFRSRSNRLASDMLVGIGSIGIDTNRGVKDDTKTHLFATKGKGLGILRGVHHRMPAILLEMWFASNEHDWRTMTPATSREVYAIQVARAICRHYGLDPRMDLLAPNFND